MAEPTLALQYTDFLAEVGLFLGFGRGASNGDTAWSTQTQALLESIVRSGHRQFYYPPAVPPETTGYDWSFLKPTATLSLAQGASVVPLPDDFGGFEGTITLVTSTTTAQPWRIEWTNEGSIRQRYAVTPSMTGAPMAAAEQWIKGTTAVAGQRAQLYIFPLADQAYTLQVPYYINPDVLTGANPYSYGGAQHSETILESCLAIAEQRLDDASSVHSMKFMERLGASIAMDRKNKPQRLGYNRDRSDRPGFDRGDVHWWAPPATYNGGSFD